MSQCVADRDGAAEGVACEHEPVDSQFRGQPVNSLCQVSPAVTTLRVWTSQAMTWQIERDHAMVLLKILGPGFPAEEVCALAVYEYDGWAGATVADMKAHSVHHHEARWRCCIPRFERDRIKIKSDQADSAG